MTRFQSKRPSTTTGHWPGCSPDASRRGRHCRATWCTSLGHPDGRRQSCRPTNGTRQDASLNRPAPRLLPPALTVLLLTPTVALSASPPAGDWCMTHLRAPAHTAAATSPLRPRLLVPGVGDLHLNLLRLHVEQHLLRIAGAVREQGKRH